MKIYLDCCCYNRPFDESTQERIYLESNIILEIIDDCKKGNNEIIASSMLDLEIDNISNPDKKEKVVELYSFANIFCSISEFTNKRAEEIRTNSKIRFSDSMHIALAEDAYADVMVTVDDKLVKMAEKLALSVKVITPTQFKEAYNNEK